MNAPRDQRWPPDQIDLHVVLPTRVFGGAERTIANLLEGMALLPSAPSVTIYGDPALLRPHVPQGLAVAWVDITVWPVGTALQTLRGTRADAARLAAHVAAQRRPGRKTVVLCMLHYGVGLAVWMRRALRHQPDTRVLASPRGPSVLGIPMITPHRWQRWLLHGHVAAAGRWCDGVIVPSDGMRRELLRRYRARADRVWAVPNSYPTRLDDAWAQRQCAGSGADDATPLTGGVRFVMASRLSGEKAIGWAIAAFARHAAAHPRDTLTVIGDGPDRPLLQADVAARGLQDRVRLQPFAQDPFGAMAQHDVYVHTCLLEGFGNSMVEALALGLPVIATDCDFGPRHIVWPGINGWLVAPGDEAALADAMAAVHRWPMDRWRRAARASALNYTSFAMAARYVDIFARV